MALSRSTDRGKGHTLQGCWKLFEGSQFPSPLIENGTQKPTQHAIELLPFGVGDGLESVGEEAVIASLKGIHDLIATDLPFLTHRVTQIRQQIETISKPKQDFAFLLIAPLPMGWTSILRQ
jgi:hypothetical protein